MRTIQTSLEFPIVIVRYQKLKRVTFMRNSTSGGIIKEKTKTKKERKKEKK